ncbi:MAG: hypothetical protein AAF587_34905 [Bacteroidota bacterium]
MSILIADSGASKTQWALCGEEEKPLSFTTIGFNPNAVSLALIRHALEELASAIGDVSRITDVFFYGSGVVDEKGRSTLRKVFAPVFSSAKIYLDSDLVAAMRSTGRQMGIVGILGTGSNACYFREGQIQEKRGGHGYLVGDEGSGQDLGKALLKGLLYETLPDHLLSYVLKKEQQSLHELKMGVYTSSRPSAYLASLARHLLPFQQEEPVRLLIRSCFETFLQTTILHMPFSSELPIDTIGSIGYYFQEIWRESCQGFDLNMGKILQNPMQGLIAFHTRSGN